MDEAIPLSKSPPRRLPTPPPIPTKDGSSAADNSSKARPKYPYININGKRILLDVEEDEIKEEIERRTERKKRKEKRREKSVEKSPEPDEPVSLPLSKSPPRRLPTPPPIPTKDDASNNTSRPPIKYPTIVINGKTILLDVEEGEICEEIERRTERKKKKEKLEKLVEKSKKKKDDGLEKPKKKTEKERREKSIEKALKKKEEQEKSIEKYKKQYQKTFEKRAARSRSKSPEKSYYYNSVDRSSNNNTSSHEGDDYRNSSRRNSGARGSSDRDRDDYRNSTRRCSGHDDDYKNSVRRTSAYDDDYHRNYSGSRGGFGFRGQSYRYEDDYYDYRKNRRYHRGGRSRSRSNSRSRSRSRYRERSKLRRLHPDDIIDKAVLLEIARKNASKLMRSGVLPTDIFSRDQILAIKAGGKSVEELTEYCKRIAKRDALGDAGDESSDEEYSIHHPFNVIDRPMPAITMNIRNAIPLPIRSAHELAIENARLKIVFPVSSGTQHRYKEIEWKAVEKDEEKKKTEDLTKALLPVGTVHPIMKETPEEESKSTGLEITLEPKPATAVDIGTVISKRLKAMKELQENPDDSKAKEKLEIATAEMKEWAEAKALEPKFLTPAELLTGPQAWAKKDQLKTATAVQGGMGMHLLQRMGWNPGEGLGKNKEGSTEPLALDIKADKKGLSTASDKGPSLPSVFDLSGKHPVSSLMELCAKRRWGDPTFLLCFEYGPSHRKQFVYKVTVNGVEYQPCVAVNNKKEAKANAAAFCLQSMGLLPTPKNTVTEPAKPAELLKTVPDKNSEPSSIKSSSKKLKHDAALMPPPPPPPALARLLDNPIPPPPPPPPPSIPPLQPPPPLPSLLQELGTMGLGLRMSHPQTQPHARPQSLMEMKLMNLAGMSTMSSMSQQIPQTPLHHQYNPLLNPTPIVQVPLPPSSTIQGFPGLTTF